MHPRTLRVVRVGSRPAGCQAGDGASESAVGTAHVAVCKPDITRAHGARVDWHPAPQRAAGRAGMATAKAGSLGPAGPCWALWLCGVCVTRQPARDGEDVAPVTPAILRGSILGTGGGMWGVVWKGDFLRTVA